MEGVVRGVAVVGMAVVGSGMEDMGGDWLDERPLMGGASTAATNMGVVTVARGGVSTLSPVMQVLGVALAVLVVVALVVGVAFTSSTVLSVGVTSDSDSGMTMGNSTLLEITASHLSMDHIIIMHTQ